jgi:hypothetical protein
MVLGERAYSATLDHLLEVLTSDYTPNDLVLENTSYYDTFSRDCSLCRETRWQMQSELGNEWSAELAVQLMEDSGPLIPPGG